MNSSGICPFLVARVSVPHISVAPTTAGCTHLSGLSLPTGVHSAHAQARMHVQRWWAPQRAAPTKASVAYRDNYSYSLYWFSFLLILFPIPYHALWDHLLNVCTQIFLSGSPSIGKSSLTHITALPQSSHRCLGTSLWSLEPQHPPQEEWDNISKANLTRELGRFQNSLSKWLRIVPGIQQAFSKW